MLKARSTAAAVPALAVTVALALVACGEESPTEPGTTQSPPAVASVVLTPEAPQLFSLGATVQLTARAYDQEGVELSGVRFAWVSSDPGVATVTRAGKVTAVSNGRAAITASAGEVSGLVTVTVDQEAARLRFLDGPQCGVPAGATITPVLKVVIQDANGHLVTDAADAVTLVLAANSVGAVLHGTTTISAAAGVATFSDLSVDRDGEGFALLASAGPLASATSAAFDIYKGPRTLCVVDPIGDHTGRIDVVKVVMNFDDVTGHYEIVLTAHAANPFAGDFRININLFNPDVGTSARYPSFFNDVLNDYRAAPPVTKLSLTGADSRLTAWQPGDRVFTNSLAGTGNPEGVSLFRSSVADLPSVGFLTDEDVVAFSKLAQPAVVR